MIKNYEILLLIALVLATDQFPVIDAPRKYRVFGTVPGHRPILRNTNTLRGQVFSTPRYPPNPGTKCKSDPRSSLQEAGLA